MNDTIKSTPRLWSGAKNLMAIYAAESQAAESKTLAQRLRDCPIDAVEDDSHEFFSVCVSKGLMSNRTSL